MPTYRVYIRRPSTHAPFWDWAQTVVAPEPNIALGYAYSSWQNSDPSYPVPALNLCQYSVNLAAAMAAKPLANKAFGSADSGANAGAISPAQQAFIDQIKNATSQLLSTQLDGEFQVVNHPAGFNYGITYGNNGYYNQATLQDIDSLLARSSNGDLELTSQGFSSLYVQLMQGVTFSFSQQDNATMNRQDTAASAQITSILTEFENAGGTYSNPLPFGGKLQDIVNQLTKLYTSLDNLPDTLNALRNAIASWKSLAGDSYVLHNRYYVATDRIQAAIKNATKPAAANGGQQVDASNYFVGYTPNKLPTANQLIGGLQTLKNAVSVTISLTNFTSKTTNASISGRAGFSIPIVDICTISVGGSAAYDFSRYTSSSTTITMDIEYHGVTVFSAMPSALSTDNTKGWYANDILADVVAKTGHDATGYKLQGSAIDINAEFGRGKVFSRLKTFVISQYPTIKLTFSGVDVNSVVKDFQQKSSASVKLFGLFTVGSAASSYSVHDVQSNTQAGTVTVTMGPPEVSGTIPLQQQVAYVLGGVASYPPNDI